MADVIARIQVNMIRNVNQYISKKKVKTLFQTQKLKVNTNLATTLNLFIVNSCVLIAFFASPMYSSKLKKC